MATIKYFTTYSTVEDLKHNYRVLVQKYHPDCGGSESDMIAINSEYEYLFDMAKEGSKVNAEESGSTWHETAHDINDGFRAIICNIAAIQGVIVEVCGSWVWVSGETKPVKDLLKTAGFKFAMKKVAWYWHSGEYKHFAKGKNYSLEEIRHIHGSQRVKGSAQLQIA